MSRSSKTIRTSSTVPTTVTGRWAYFVGTEYGGRQLQYEMFYSAAQPVVNRRMFRSYDWSSAKAMVDRLLSEY